MEASMERLLALIDDVYKYVDNVVEGRVAPDNSIGRFIADTVASLPKMPPSAVDILMNDSLQDHLLLLYLSSITRTQLSLAEKMCEHICSDPVIPIIWRNQAKTINFPFLVL